MQRASAVFGVLVFVLWLVVLAVGVAYVTVWAATRRRPQWSFLSWLSRKTPAEERREKAAVPLRIVAATPVQDVPPDTSPTDPSAPGRPTAQIIPFERPPAHRRSQSA